MSSALITFHSRDAPQKTKGTVKIWIIIIFPYTKNAIELREIKMQHQDLLVPLGDDIVEMHLVPQLTLQAISPLSLVSRGWYSLLSNANTGRVLIEHNFGIPAATLNKFADFMIEKGSTVSFTKIYQKLCRFNVNQEKNNDEHRTHHGLTYFIRSPHQHFLLLACCLSNMDSTIKLLEEIAHDEIQIWIKIAIQLHSNHFLKTLFTTENKFQLKPDLEILHQTAMAGNFEMLSPEGFFPLGADCSRHDAQ